MARSLLIAHRQNATIEELKQVSRVGSTETATRCTAIQMLLAGIDRQHVCNALLVTNRALRKWINRFNPLAQLATDVLATVSARYQPDRTHLAYNQSTLVQQLCM